MRRTIKGAAAVAAICAGALTMTSVPAFAAPGSELGSGTDAQSYRVAGVDRIQTSLEGLEDFSEVGPMNLMIVGYRGVVDALSLAPLAKTIGHSAVLYSAPDGLDARTVASLKNLTNDKDKVGKIIISGGFGVVPATVEQQLVKLGYSMDQIVRIAGKDRFETSYLTGAYTKNWHGMELAGRKLSQAQYKKQQLPVAKAAFEQAQAANDAAVMKRDATVKAYMAAAKAFNDAVKALGDTDVKAATEALDDALNPKSFNDLKKLEGVAPYMRKVEEATAVLKKQQQYADVDLTLKQVLDAATAAGDTDTVKAVNVVIAAVILDDADATGAGLSLVMSVGKARAQYDQVVKNATKALESTGLKIAKAMLKVHQTQAAKNAMLDPNSAVSKAAVAVVEAEKAKNEAAEALKKSVMDLAVKKHAYKVLFNESFNDFELASLQKKFNEEAAKTYEAGNFNLFLSTGTNFADALTAGPAAANNDGVILLTNGMEAPAYVTAAAKASHKTVYGIGGPAAKAFVNSVPVIGSDRYDTSAKVAAKFFKGHYGVYALASGETGADAVVAGVYMTSADHDVTSLDYRAVLLTQRDKLPESVRDYVSYGTHAQAQKPIKGFVVFGGEGVIKDSVVDAAVKAAIK